MPRGHLVSSGDIDLDKRVDFVIPDEQMGPPVDVLVVCSDRLRSKRYSTSSISTEHMEEMATLTTFSSMSMSMSTTVSSMFVVVLWAMPVIDEMSGYWIILEGSPLPHRRCAPN